MSVGGANELSGEGGGLLRARVAVKWWSVIVRQVTNCFPFSKNDTQKGCCAGRKSMFYEKAKWGISKGEGS